MTNEFFTLLGPSGCGKTTLLRLLAGFEHPTAGTILLDGKHLVDDPPNKRPVNTVFQSYALFPHMTIEQNVAFGLERKGLRGAAVKERVSAMLRLVRLEALAQRRPDQLSGGQQQRVALARALAPQPRLLLLDEPLSALDLKLRRGMQVELKRIQRETGITFVLVTHDQEEALSMSDRIAVMNQGRVLQLGRPDDIYERPVSRFVADFIGEANVLPGVSRGAARGGFRGDPARARRSLDRHDPGRAQPVRTGRRRHLSRGHDLLCDRARCRSDHQGRTPGPAGHLVAGQPVRCVFPPEALLVLED